MPDPISSYSQASVPTQTTPPQPQPAEARDRDTNLRPEQRAEAPQESEQAEPRRPEPAGPVGNNIDTRA